jgi:hypothetical protein
MKYIDLVFGVRLQDAISAAKAWSTYKKIRCSLCADEDEAEKILQAKIVNQQLPSSIKGVTVEVVQRKGMEELIEAV